MFDVRRSTGALVYSAFPIFPLTPRPQPSLPCPATASASSSCSNLDLLKASVLVNDLVSVPSCPDVKLLGNGPLSSFDEGRITDVTLKHPMHFAFHKDTLPVDDFKHTRW